MIITVKQKLSITQKNDASLTPLHGREIFHWYNNPKIALRIRWFALYLVYKEIACFAS
jgi:hypothetical protein